MRRFAPLPIIIVLLLVTASSSPSWAQEKPQEAVQLYIGELIRGDWEAAEACWHTDDVRKAHRLGIAYDGAPLKVDCSSPLFAALPQIRSAQLTLMYGPTEFDGDVAAVPVAIRDDAHATWYMYHVLHADGRWTLISPITARTRGWKTLETRYLRVYYQDSSLINEYALAEADRFVADLAMMWQAFDENMRHLESVKLDYVLGDADDMKAITGHEAHGMTSLPMDAIVTRHLPHYHELVHALVNYRLTHRALYTLPIVQEGLAVAVGGRWEKSAEVLLQFGAFMLEAGFVDLPDVLSDDGFNNGVGSLDISYATGGLLVGHLINEYGISRFLKLYEYLSTPGTEYRSWTVDSVKSRIERVYRLRWETVEAGVKTYAEIHRGGRLLPGGDAGSTPPILSLGDDVLRVRVWDAGTDYVFAITSQAEQPGCVIALRDTSDHASPWYRSRLFGKHLPDTPYAHERFGIQATNAEAGLYDYYTDNLLEKYVLSFDPSDDYWEPNSKVIRFRLAKPALPMPLEEYAVELLRP